MRVGLAALVVLIALTISSCATAKGSGFSREASKERSAQNKDKKPESSNSSDDQKTEEPPTLTIVATPSNAEITIDGRYAGTGTATLNSSGFGQSVVISASAPAYHSRAITVSLWGQRDTVNLDLDPILGALEIRGPDLNGAKFFLKDWAVGPGRSPIIIGDHDLLIRKFGFADQRERVTIRENETTTLDITFQPVPFSLTDLRNLRPDGFNPDSAAIAATTKLTFQASGPGHAAATLRNSAGATVATWDFPHLETWNQEMVWNGRVDGAALPDGDYQMTLIGGAEPGTDTETHTVTVRIDRSLIDRDRTSIGPAAGLLWTPVPEVLSPGTAQVSLLALSHIDSDSSHTPFSTSFRFAPAAGWELFAESSVRFWSDYELNSFYGTFSVKQRIPIDSPDFRLAWIAGATLATWIYGAAGIPPTDYLTTFPAVKALLPAEWSWGRWSLLVAPEVDWSTYSPASAYQSAPGAEEGARGWGYGRFGISYDGGPFSVGVSGAARTRTFDQGLGWMAPAQLGVEGRYTLPGTPLTLTGYLSVSAYTTVDYAWYGGAGFSLLIPSAITLDLASQL